MEPAPVSLAEIPQGIDDLVVIGSGLAVQCGPVWFALHRDLSGLPRPLTPDEVREAGTSTGQIDLLDWNNHREDDEWTVPLPNGTEVPLRLPGVRRWGFTATRSPDARTIALAGATQPPRPVRSFDDAIEGAYEPDPWVLVLIDVGTGVLRRCSGEFDNFCYAPAWTLDSQYVAFGAPFEPKRLYFVDRTEPQLNVVKFRRHAPMPLLDAAALEARPPNDPAAP